MSNIKSWFVGLRGKLVFAAFIPLVAFIFIGFVAISGTDKLSNMLNESYADEQPSIISLSDALHARASVGYFLWASYGTFDNDKLREDYLKKTETNINAFEEAVKKYESTPSTPDELAAWSPAKDNYADFIKYSKESMALLKENTPLTREQALKLIAGGPWQKAAIAFRKGAEGVLDKYKETAQLNLAAQAKLKAEVKNLLLLSSLIAIFTTFGVLLWIAYRTSSSVSSIVTNINHSGSQVSAAIEQLTAAGMNLSQSSTNAAASLEETVASLEEMTSMVQMNSDNAKQAAALSVNSIETATRGEVEIKVLVNSMQDISDSSKKIAEIIHVIDDIAFQTNLLALNASVEAARAGEHGKGFAVVADAVRTLAQRSATAAKDIASLIKESVEKIEHGTVVASKGGAVMSDIVVAVKKVSDLANEIAAASSEQTTGIQQISKAMNQLDQSSQSNAASSEEIASTAEEISSQALQMQTQVENLSAQISGTTVMTGPTPVAVQKSEKKKFDSFKPVAAKPEDKKPSQNKKIVESKPAPQTVALTAKSSPSSSKDIIPFDEDDGRGNIGDASGF